MCCNVCKKVLLHNIYHRLMAITLFLLTSICGQIEKNAWGKGNGPQMQNSPCLWSVLKLLLLNLQTLNVILKTIPENFIRTYQKVAQGCPFRLFSWLPVAFGHRSAFFVHSFMGYSFCPTLPNTCLSTSVWNSIFSGLNWFFFFMCVFFS